MDFVENFFLPPSSDHLFLIKYLILLIYFIHMPFISLIIGGTFFSLFFRILAVLNNSSFYYRVSDFFVEKLIFRKTAGIILGVLPLVILTLIEGQVFYDAHIAIVQFLVYSTILVAMGITMVYFYEASIRMRFNSVVTFISGAGSVFFLFLGYFVFCVDSSLILDPGRWAVVKGFSDFLFSWNVVARFNHFIFTAFAVSGAGLLFLTFNWQETQEKLEAGFLKQIRKIAGGITLAFTLLQPILLFWNLVTMPAISLSESVFSIAVVVILLIFIICVHLYKILQDQRVKPSNRIFILFIITLIFILANDHLARENSIQNHTALLTSRALEVENEITTEREQLRAAAIKVDPNLGKQVFENQCLSCHRFDQKVVGPPYNEVLLKYSGDEKALEDFIRKPSKVNPDYPAMPQLGLSESEIKSVAAYLLQVFQEKQ
jgi:cytochrome c